MLHKTVNYFLTCIGSGSKVVTRTLQLALPKCFETSASNSLRHKKKAVLDRFLR